MEEDKHYEIKKIIANLMALSIIGSSSFIFGGTAKAASLNSTSTYTMDVSDFLSDVHITSNGVLMWNTTPEIPTYRYKIMKIESRYLQETGIGGVSNHNFHSPDI